jgi:hypothetical protein
VVDPEAIRGAKKSRGLSRGPGLVGRPPLCVARTLRAGCGSDNKAIFAILCPIASTPPIGPSMIGLH